MPPKDSGMSKKTENKKKEKVVEDLTFGLKNKNKSKVVQQYVKEVTNKVMFSQVKVSESFCSQLHMMEQRAWQNFPKLTFRVERKQSRSNRGKRKKPKRRRRSNKRFCKVYSSKSPRSRPLRAVKLTTRQRYALISNLVFAKRERDANIPTI